MVMNTLFEFLVHRANRTYVLSSKTNQHIESFQASIPFVNTTFDISADHALSHDLCYTHYLHRSLPPSNMYNNK